MPYSGFRSLKARYVLPATSPPIAGGVVTIRGQAIVAVDKQAPAGPVEDLGNVAILPGFVNAHVHLELSGLAEPLGKPGGSLTDWIATLVESFRHGAAPAPEAIRRGLEECMRSGTTTLGEIAQPGWPAEPFAAAGLDATVFLELIAPTGEGVEAKLELARRHVEGPWPIAWGRPGLSPHAPYSVHPKLLAAAVALSARQKVPLAMHLAESAAELELLRTGGGPFRDLLCRWGQWDPELLRPGTRPLDYLRTLARADRVLVVHGNYLDDEEIALLAEHRQRMSVVYCPRTHAYFAHPPYPLEKTLSAGVTVALGTDSRASSPDLSLLAEMRAVAARHPAVSRDVVLGMATIFGARALGRDAEVGSLQPGKSADLAIVALPDRDAADPYALLLDSDMPVLDTWRKGRELAPIQ
jgi:cytosine/adenosine deaminase-related metal-dependent hydrolase